MGQLQRLMKLKDLLEIEAHLPVKQPLLDKFVLLYSDNGQPSVKLVKEAAWNLDCKTLVESSDPACVQQLETIFDDDVLWVVFPTEKEVIKAKKMDGYGLGSFVAPSEPISTFSSPAVPEPWMGTYGDNQPVIPCSQESPTAGGLEWQRMQGAGGESMAAQVDQSRMQQTTISSMFSRQPMTIEPMDF